MINMKNIAIVIPNITTRAGTERAVSNLANILYKIGYNVFILSIASNSGNCPFFLDDSIHIIHLKLPYVKKNLGFFIVHYLKIFYSLKDLAKKLNLDAYIGTYNLLNFIISLLPKSLKKIGCEHFNYEASNKMINFAKRFFYKRLNAVVLLTERDKEHYKFCKNVFVIPNSLSFIPTNINDCKQKKMISLGRLTRQKGYDLLIKSISIIKEHLEGWIIEIYGDGEDKNELQKSILNLGLEHLISIKAPSNDVQDIYLSASIYLSSSRWEGLPMVLLEAQSCGIPCVAFDCRCGPAEIIENDKTGYVVPLGDLELFSRKVLYLVQNERIRMELGKNARIESERFSTENILIKWKDLFENLNKQKQ